MKKTISGIRGIAGRDLNLKNIVEFCNGFAKLAGGRCVIARDTRPSGEMISGAVSSALLQNGIDVYDLGVAATPIPFRESRRYGSAVVITASHNPTEWNGLKFAISGRGINQPELGCILESRDSMQNRIGSYHAAESDYVREAAGIAGSAAGVKAVVDAGGGAARTSAPKLLEKIGCKVETINPDLDNASRGPDPTSDPLSDLKKCSKSADIGFAFDLDGDRAVLARDGRTLSPDATLGLGVAWALGRGHARYVLSVDTSAAIERMILEQGGSVWHSPVGEANVADMMMKKDAQAGGEGSSAGFILPEFNYCRDGLLASGLASSMLAGSDFDGLMSFMDGYHREREKITADSKTHHAVMEYAKDKMEKEYGKAITIDGVKCMPDHDSWVLVRPSNTEDAIRVSAESDSRKKTAGMISSIRKMVAECHDT